MNELHDKIILYEPGKKECMMSNVSHLRCKHVVRTIIYPPKG